MGATFTPLVCSVYGLLHLDVLALLRLQSARASDAHVNRIGGRKAFINLLLELEHASICSPLSLVPSRSATASSSTRPCRRSSLLCLALKAR
jgi:hypothetical protein